MADCEYCGEKVERSVYIDEIVNFMSRRLQNYDFAKKLSWGTSFREPNEEEFTSVWGKISLICTCHHVRKFRYYLSG